MAFFAKNSAKNSADEANRNYFRQAYRTGRHGWGIQEPSPYAVEFLRRLAALLPKNVPGGRLLDVGCGEGRHAIAAAKLGFQVTAIDFEPLALKRARRFAAQHGAKSTRFQVANMLALPFADSAFDIVLDYGCLHHQKKSAWPAYKANVLRVLKPGGFYVLSVFSPRFYLFHGSRRPWHIAQGAYRRYFTRRDLTRLFAGELRIMELTEEKGEHQGFWHLLACSSMA